MTDVVQAMSSSGGRFDYDLVNYTVTSPRDRTRGTYAYSEGPPADDYDGYAYPYYGAGYGGYGYGPYCDPWWGGCPGYAFAYDPWLYDPWFYSPFGFGFGSRFGFGFGFGFGGGFFPGRFAFGGKPALLPWALVLPGALLRGWESDRVPWSRTGFGEPRHGGVRERASDDVARRYQRRRFPRWIREQRRRRDGLPARAGG